VVADLDGPNARLIAEPDFGAAITAAPAGWAAVFANARNTYYDIEALRHPTWCPGAIAAPRECCPGATPPMCDGSRDQRRQGSA